MDFEILRALPWLAKEALETNVPLEQGWATSGLECQPAGQRPSRPGVAHPCFGERIDQLQLSAVFDVMCLIRP